jgi:hypothetical protein
MKTLLAAVMAFATVAVAGIAISQDLPTAPVVGTDFRQSLSHYATVDRADGKVYELFINETGLTSWQDNRRLAPGSQFVIESFDAARLSSGELARDALGRLQKAESDNELHVSEKQAGWVPSTDCTTPSLMNGRPMNATDGGGFWRMAALDPRDGQRIARASNKQGECHQCHQENRAEDFIMSRGLLDSFARSGNVAYISFACGARDICFGGPPELSNKEEMPDCPAEFAVR